MMVMMTAGGFLGTIKEEIEGTVGQCRPLSRHMGKTLENVRASAAHLHAAHSTRYAAVRIFPAGKIGVGLTLITAGMHLELPHFAYILHWLGA